MSDGETVLTSPPEGYILLTDYCRAAGISRSTAALDSDDAVVGYVQLDK